MAYLDYTGLQRFWEQVKNRLDNKVDKSEGQSDWSVDDATSPSYIKNRTHYDTILSKTLFDGTITATAGTLTRINSIPDEMIVNYPDVSVVRATFDGKACTITATTNKWELRDPNGQLVFTMNYDTAKGAQCLVSTYAGSGAHTLVIEADEITAVPLDEKYIPNTIPRRTDIPKMAMPDWNASEGEAGYVKNRTHYEEKNVIIPNTIVDVPSSDLFAALPVLDTAIVAGNSYVVELDNEKYTCVAWADGDVIYLGNGNVYPGVNKGENVPFSIDTYPDKTAFLNTQVGKEYVVSIATPGNIKQLDEKFIPDSVKMPKTEEANMQLITDGEGNAKWEERTHWVEYGTTYNYYSTNNEKVSFNEGLYYSKSYVENIEEGSKIEVNWNGDIFVCEAKTLQENGLTAIAFGNLSDESEPPFVGIILPPAVTGREGYALQMVDLNSNNGNEELTENSFDINVTPVTYHTIDPKYLGNNIVIRNPIIFTGNLETGELSTDFNFETAWAMSEEELQSNIVVKFEISDGVNSLLNNWAVFGVEKTNYIGGRVIYFHHLPYNDYNVFYHNIYFWREDGHVGMERQGQLLPSANNDNSFLIYSDSGDRWSEYSLEQTKALLQSGVSSVNGQVGNVTLTAEDVGAATASYVDTKVAALVDSSPDTLNTLNELAAALGDDPNFATTIATQIGELEESKVEKIAGKGLSTNDYTTADKTLLNTIAEQYLTRDDVADLNTKIEAAHSHATTYKGSAFANGLYKITTNAEGHVTGATAVAKTDITALGIPAQDTDTGATSVEVTGAGNAITAASYDAISRKLTLTKGATYTNNQGTITGVNAGTSLSGGGTSGAVSISHAEGSAINKTVGLYKFATDATSHVKSVTAVNKADIIALGIPAQDTTYSAITNNEIDAICGQL